MKTKLFLTCLILVLVNLSIKAQQNALDFDNVDDFVSVPAASALISGATQLSMTMWVKPNNLTGAWPDYDGFGGFRNDVDADFYLVQLGSTGIEGRFRGTAGVAYTISANNLQPSVWQHLTLTYDGSMLKFYMNGQEATSIPASGTISNQSVDFLMGKLIYSITNFFFLGQLDEVSLWNKALTIQEIQHIYTCAINPSAANLLLYYKYDQGIAGGNNSGILNANTSAGTLNGTLNNFGLTGASSNFVAGVSTPVNAINHTICNGQSYQFGNLNLTTPGVYTQTFTTSGGCDSVVQLSLAVSTVNTAMSQSGITLTAALAGATYKWVNCSNNFSAIPGAVNQSFTPASNGIYACIITFNGCSDTTICKSVTTVGIGEEHKSAITIYPNPVTDILTLELNGINQTGVLTLNDISGKAIFNRELAESDFVQVNMSPYSQGVYILKYRNADVSKVWKVIKE